MEELKIHFIGCGNMAGAMLTHWIHKEAPLKATIIKPSAPSALLAPHVTYSSSYDNVSSQADVTMLGVKPQMMREVYVKAVGHYGTSPLYVTMAAGLDCNVYKTLAPECGILRIMPNTPVGIGQGVVSCYVTDEDRQRYLSQIESLKILLNILGTCCWLEDETLFDAATAIAGSGPAYVYLFIEALVQAGVGQGICKDTSTLLAMNMVQGASAYAAQSQDSLEALRHQVTSKGGTTQAALNVLMKDDALIGLIHDAIEAAVKRAKELAQ